MPRRQDIKRVLLLGSGPIVIGQACEFDYSGTQACKALMQEGVEVILVNSNPATIMTDPEIATRVYVEPLNLAHLEKIIEVEKPDSVIPTLGGQTALNAGLALSEKGILKKYGVELLGTTAEVIQAGENRDLFKKILDKVGAKAPKSFLVKNYEQAMDVASELGLPIILRPNYTLGGGGGGIAYSLEEYQRMIQNALYESPTSEVLVEQSILGWKEYELEVMRDKAGTFVIVCSIENFDPCGVHTGDSITVAPQQTLSDREYQAMRSEAQAIIEAIGLETGGANIQFAVDPKTGERVVIEMNPRVSRSSALASKATGFPIAKIAALVAIGYTLDEIKNDITKSTPSCFEPALDYVVTKIPKFAFEKFPGTQDLLTTQMKSVGEVMAIGRTFKESLHKAIQSLENKDNYFSPIKLDTQKLSYANSQRLFHLFQAFRDGLSVEELCQLTQIDPWFLEQIEGLVQIEREIENRELTYENLLYFKRNGFSDQHIAQIKNLSAESVKQRRDQLNIKPGYLRVDTCAGEFLSETPYYYSTYWSKDRELPHSNQERVIILGSGPNRIGQGIEFDYSCVRGVKAFQNEGYRVAMVNSNPETVSTDYDTAHELFFEPLTVESVGEVMDFLKPIGFVAQLGGQTPIHLAPGLVSQGYTLMGSSLTTIDLAEDRKRFGELCNKLGFKIPRSGVATNVEEAITLMSDIGYPAICRPSYVLGGRRMEVVENESELIDYFHRNEAFIGTTSPLFIDQFLEGALEVDIDVVACKTWKTVGGIIEHIEAAGIHSGDSMGVLPPQRLKDETCNKIESLSLRLAEELNVEGLLNIQMAIKNDEIYILEANPRSSRTVPFIAKATGIPLIDLAVRAMLNKSIDQGWDWKKTNLISVKGVVFPFKKFSDADSILGPEMRSTGETMGRGVDYGEALLKAFLGSNTKLPHEGEVFLSLREKDKVRLLPVARELYKMGYKISATHGTAKYLNIHGVPCEGHNKVYEGRPHCVDHIRSGGIAFVINTTSGRQSIQDSFLIRRSCIDYFIPCITENDTAEAFVMALKRDIQSDLQVRPLS